MRYTYSVFHYPSTVDRPMQSTHGIKSLRRAKSALRLYRRPATGITYIYRYCDTLAGQLTERIAWRAWSADRAHWTKY